MRINLVNAGLVAEQRGMNLIERKKHEHDLRYDTMLAIRAKTGVSEFTVRGAMLQGEPCIVAIDDLWVDFPASGHLVISLHQDRPGIIGNVGTILGQSDVNISFMHVGRHAPRTTAVMVLGTDEAVPDSLMQTLNAQDHIEWLHSVSL